MKNSDKILELIDSFYSYHNVDGGYKFTKQTDDRRAIFVNNHNNLIGKLEKYWIDFYVIPPELGSRVFTI